MSSFKASPLLLGLVCFFFLVKPTLAFGAGNIAGISKVEGQNWRHGDIEDTLLKLMMARVVGGKKFDKLNVSRVYFGNWLRDYSQAIDVGTVKAVSAEAIRLLLCVLGFMTFGYGSREFEVTAYRLGTYRPEDHIDNPKNYADNADARQYDERLRGPVDERVELAIDEQTGMKNYIANERAGIMTSAQHIRRLFGESIELMRGYHRSHKKADFYEALRLMGTGLHCLEDFLAHSNYTELALIEMGERDVFPHVGRNCRIRLRGARHEVYPIVTGTFGGVDFLHSVTGEVSDKLTQNEINELEGTLQNSQNSDTSVLRNLLDMIPDGLFGGDNKKQKMEQIQSNATNAQMENTSISPREPEEFTRYVQNVFKQVMPAIEFHDEILKTISEAVEKIPVLPKIIEQLEDQLSIFVFSCIAPLVVPLIKQIKNELKTGSSEIIQSSVNEQHIVFEDDRCDDPTHSMLSKDHFSNILNEIAGRTASGVVAWVVPQLMEAWDDERADIDRLLNRIIGGILHHPAQRDMGEDGAQEGRQMMFRSVEEWWSSMDRRQQDEYRQKLSRDGVERGENHKEGVQDCGHGCAKPLGMHKNYGGGGKQTTEDKIADAAAGAIVSGLTSGFSNIVESNTGVKIPHESSSGEFIPGNGGGSSSHHGNGLGGLLDAAGSLLGVGFDKKEAQTLSGRTNDGGYTQTATEYGRNDDGTRYGQAQVQRTEYSDGSQRTEYNRYEQDEDSYGSRPTGSRYEERTETRPSYGGGYEERTERRWENEQGSYREEDRTSGYGSQRRQDRYDDGGYGGRGDEGGYGGRGDEGGYGGRQQESSGFGEDNYGSGGYGGGNRRDDDNNGRQQERYDDRRDERRDEGSGGFFGGGGGGLVSNLMQAAEEAFDDNDDRRGERRDW